jgi:pilus assembly protein CpaB
MRLGSLVTFAVALMLAVSAGLLAQHWLEAQRRGAVPPTQSRPQTAKIVVAAQPLRFGMELSAANLKEIEWGTSKLPAGAFSTTAELLRANERRVVLSAIEPNEPILQWKITGSGQRAALSALIDSGMKAVTIRVNDVFGVAGFVLPGDRVDVLLTLAEAGGDKHKFTDVLLQHVRVLAIDQLADDRTEKATVVKAVTLEVKTPDAQKLALAGTVGSLSLALRPAGTARTTTTQRISVDDLSRASDDIGQVGVRRGTQDPNLYTVPVESSQREAGG